MELVEGYVPRYILVQPRTCSGQIAPKIAAGQTLASGDEFRSATNPLNLAALAH